jgi:hypothetical protein
MYSVAVTAPSRTRLTALRVLAVAYAAFVGLASFGLPSLLTSWSTTGDELPLRTAYVVWGVLAGLVVPALALALLSRRTAPAVPQALGCLLCACLLVLVLGFKVEHLQYVAGVAIPALLLLALHPERAVPRVPRRAVDPLAAIVVGSIALPTIWYGVDMALTSRTTSVLDTPSGTFTMHGQYAQAAVLAFTLILVAAVGVLRQPGRRFLIALVVVSACILGTAGLLFPHDPMSLGATWGAVTLVAAAAYAVVGLRPTNERPGSSTPVGPGVRYGTAGVRRTGRGRARS